MNDTTPAGTEPSTQVEADRRQILAARERGFGATLATYTRLSGPGWLQGAITLGGGSLAGSLYLGVIGGYQMLWLQPLMMILGIIMLSAISYVTLSTGLRPFDAINRHVNPVLGWGWAIATLMANMVWAMPQFSLGTAAMRQNLGLFTGEGGEFVCAGLLFVAGAIVVSFYGSGGWGLKLFEMTLKAMVGVVVVSFFGVVLVMSFKGDGLPWGDILAGFIPDFGLMNRPADGFTPLLEASPFGDFWRERILASQRDKMVTAAATAVGINMTFLLPYSILKRGWDKDFRSLATFDLSLGLFIPFLLATSCVMIAASSRFHGVADPDLTLANGEFRGNLESRLSLELGQPVFDQLSDTEKTQRLNDLPDADKRIASMLINRDADKLASSLQDLTGPTVAHIVFGIGVLGMAISTIIILMLINGFTICEMLGQPSAGILHRVGAWIPGITGALGALFLWSGKAKFWLAEPTSVFGMVLLPIAYATFFLMINNRRLMGDHRPAGAKRLLVNGLMLLALTAATIGAAWSIWGRTKPVPGTDIQIRWVAIAIVAAFVGLAAIVQLVKKPADNA